MAIKWITKPPVVECSMQDVRFHAGRIKEDVIDWQKDASDDAEWTQHLASARKMAESIEGDRTSVEAYCYLFSGMPAGILLLEPRSSRMQLHALVSHPGFKGAGVTLVEYAVNKSQESGHGGELYLTPLDKAAADFYERLGFKATWTVNDVIYEMGLNPSERTDLWFKLADGIWQFVPLQDRRHADGIEPTKE